MDPGQIFGKAGGRLMGMEGLATMMATSKMVMRKSQPAGDNFPTPSPLRLASFSSRRTRRQSKNSLTSSVVTQSGGTQGDPGRSFQMFLDFCTTCSPSVTDLLSSF